MLPEQRIGVLADHELGRAEIILRLDAFSGPERTLVLQSRFQLLVGLDIVAGGHVPAG